MKFLLPILCSLLIHCTCDEDDSFLPAKIPSEEDFRFVRDDSDDVPMTNLVTQNPFLGANDSKEFAWVEDAVKDIAYYLRAHKFNEYDRRYETDSSSAPRHNFGSFPRPPLRALHWEVHKFCDPSFLSCVDYLRKKVALTGLKRVDDTSVAMQEQQWNGTGDRQQIEEVDVECQKMLKADDSRADPFQGPIERFQWRVTASYFMCWYTMNEVPDLKHVKENCDNFANCLDRAHGPNNFDVRANDEEPFKCALYSFCPDPCCPNSKHMSAVDDCLSSPENPCYENNPEGERDCTLRLSENTNFHDLILNRWNITCHCSDQGYEWNSQYGICIDTDECLGEKHRCKNESEICVNLPGSYFCACRWGYAWSDNECRTHGVVETIKLEMQLKKTQEEDKMAKSLFGIGYKKIKELYSIMRGGCKSFSVNIILTFVVVGCSLSSSIIN